MCSFSNDPENKFRTLLKNMNDICIELDSSMKITDCSDSALRCLDISENQPGTVSVTDCFTNEADREHFSEYFYGRGNIQGYEFTAYGKDRPETVLRAVCLEQCGTGSFLFISSDITGEDEDEYEENVSSINETVISRKAQADAAKACSVTAHELITPLRAIGIYADTIAEEEGSISESSIEALGNIKSMCSDSENLIRKIMEWSEIRNREPGNEKTDLNKIIRECITELEKVYPDTEIHMSSDSLPEIYADKILLKQAFKNILDNAVKYSSPEKHAEIHISYSSDENSHIFSVSDSGAGFDTDQNSDPFALFSRMHPSGRFRGYGIGLCTVKDIAVMHGGTVSISSAPGRGCTVTVSLKKQCSLP